MFDPSLQPLLERFETAVLPDPSVLGVLYSGSLGRGTADRFSDLDLDVWLTDDAYSDLPAKTLDLLSVLGPIEFSETRAPDFTQASIGPDWRGVDLHLRSRNDTQPRSDFAAAHIVKDFDGTLARVVAASLPEDATPTWEEARTTIIGATAEQTYIAINNARGSTWEAMGSISTKLWHLYELLARFRGRRTYGFRYLESLLSPAEQDLFRAAWPTTSIQSEVRRAAHALWTWTHYVWTEAEQHLGRPLDVTFDEASLLAAINALYDDPT